MDRDGVSAPPVCLQVYQLNQLARQLLEQAFTHVWVCGEVADLSRPRSGHYYFTLKDAQAQIRCALFKTQAMRLPFTLEAGQQLEVWAKVSLYPARGDYQLIIEKVQASGEGVLQQAFLKLKNKLQTAGLFSPHIKQALPAMPQSVGIITSSSGAAVRDIIQVLGRRSPQLAVIIYPCLVQGNDAASQITAQIALANQRRECDVLIVARGGGSLEDLWPFNQEQVVQAIAGSCLPIVTGIGHESDTTLSDLAADMRAATPSAAAELVTTHLLKQAQMLDHLLHQLQQSTRLFVQHQGQRLQHIQAQLQLAHPQNKLRLERKRLAQQQHHFQLCMQRLLQQLQQRLQHLAAKLHAVSPLQTLQRGYAIVSATAGTGECSHTISHCSQVQAGDRLQVRLQDGKLSCQVLTCNQLPVDHTSV